MRQTGNDLKKWGKFGQMCLAFALCGSAWGQINKTPPMGWNSWNNFGCTPTEALLDSTANHMVSSGMAAAGYQYINVDDCWEGARSASGVISANSANWTNGSMATVAAYIHSKGLKFGIYTSAGSKTCQSKPASYGYEGKDIQQYVAWGVDYVKVDWCNTTTTQAANPQPSYKVWGDSIQKYATSVGHPITLSICNWGDGSPWPWGRSDGGQLWRTTGDITATWASFTGIIENTQVNIAAYGGPGVAGASGGWNDPDMLEVGRGSLTADENKSHFGMWCMMAAPLIAGNDLRSMPTATQAILTNPNLIAVDQDSLGFQAQRISSTNNLEVWARPLEGNARAVALFNLSAATASITVNWSTLNKWDTTLYPWNASTAATVLDLYAGATVATNQTGSFSASVPTHGIVVLKLTPANAASIDLPLSRMQGIRLGGDMIHVDFPGFHSLQILDLSGRLLWSRSGTGVADYTPGGRADGSHILRIVTSESKSSVRY